MSTKDRYMQYVTIAIEGMWAQSGSDEPLYLTAVAVGERAGISTPTARKYLEQMHVDGWVGKKIVGKKTYVYPVVL